MRRCLKVLNLLIEKKVAETKGDKLKAWEYEGMIKRHVKNCLDCRKFLEGMYKKRNDVQMDFAKMKQCKSQT